MNKITLSILAAVTITGCQSNNTNAAQAEQTSHASQSVYEVEYAYAHHFALQAESLQTRFTEFCSNDATADRLKKEWHETMLAWMALQGQERGPETALEQSWNIQFWPDKKNTTGRKMASLTTQEKTWTATEIAQQSVTVQGLGAIEWMLYDPSSDLSLQSTSCQTGVAIAQNLSRNANTIASAWQQNPWAELDEKAWLSEYIALLSNQLEYSMKKLSRPLATFGKPRPYFSESWRSKTSMLNLQENVKAMQSLYFAKGKGLDLLLRERGKAELADRVVNQFDVTLSTWPTDKSLFDLLQTKEGYRIAYAQFNKLEQLKYLIHEEVAVELGVVIGFNATDGD
ncbi:imelysin family protein [Vibrio japonicus]|uniref:Iron-regulated protein A n=1 Tax=Vibrio japonicus TaxID=1824638 RepID=A0ABY5LPH4_9VIBR|nr:imelysin family protein [Vibrio japonicus]UUM31640.1 iron-regulated protein A [Vibrio japonicus]